LISQAKERGLPITASTPWTHVLYCDQILGDYDPMLRLDPPLGTQVDQAALQEGLKSGVLDAIAVDHRAYTYEEKTVPFAQAPPGCPGYAIALALLWQGLVQEQQWSPLTLWQKLSPGPCDCLQQASPSLTPNSPAEMVLFNPNDNATTARWSPAVVSGIVRGLWGSTGYHIYHKV
ncbi:MAG: dihydroorotase, partial [Cyanobacteria bacterium P01_F01_bin.42]